MGQEWINFEAGVGAGADVILIPALVDGLTVGDVGHPLTSLHIRSLQTLDGVHAVISDIAKRIGQIPKAAIDANAFLAIASRPTSETGWIGVDWKGQFLAVDGPVFRLRKIDDQTFAEDYAKTLREGGFRHLANRPYGSFDLCGPESGLSDRQEDVSR